MRLPCCLDIIVINRWRVSSSRLPDPKKSTRRRPISRAGIKIWSSLLFFPRFFPPARPRYGSGTNLSPGECPAEMSIAAAAKPLSVSLRRCRSGRVMLELLLPARVVTGIYSFSAGARKGEATSRLLNTEHLSALLADILGAKPPLGNAEGELSICAESHVVGFGGEVIDNLTGREFDLLHFLASNAPKVISRRDIITNAWKTAAVDNLVDVHVLNLRRKLPPALAARIQSVPGRGFRYLAPGAL